MLIILQDLVDAELKNPSIEQGRNEEWVNAERQLNQRGLFSILNIFANSEDVCWCMNKDCADSVDRESLIPCWLSRLGVSLFYESVEGESLSTLTQCSEKKISQREVKLVTWTVCDAYTGREFTEEIASSTKIYLASTESMRIYLVLVFFSKQNQGEKSEEQASPFDKKSRGLMPVYIF
jgi:hypothetical protein